MAETISFVDSLVPIKDIISDAKFYYADEGKNKNDCKYFDNKGFAGFPEDAYSIADVRLDIQLGDTPSKPVTFKIDCIMDDGSYLSESDANYAKIQYEWDDFVYLTDPVYVKKILQPLIQKIQNWEGGSVDADTCINFFKNHPLFKGQRPETIGNFIAKNIVRLLSPAQATDKVLEANTKLITNNLARAIESNNANALEFFKTCFADIVAEDLNNNFWKATAEIYAKYFPEIKRDDVVNATKDSREKHKLAQNMDSAEELMNLVKLIDDDAKNESKFIAGLTKIANGAPKGSKQQKLAQFLVKLIGTPKENT